MLQGAAQAAQEHGAADSGPDLQGMLMHHLLDGAELEFQVLGVGPVIHLPHFDPVHIGPLTLDLSPTKHVVFLFLSALICLAIFLPIGRAMKNKYSDRAPTGLANAMEAMVLYFRDGSFVGTSGTGRMPTLATFSRSSSSFFS